MGNRTLDWTGKSNWWVRFVRAIQRSNQYKYIHPYILFWAPRKNPIVTFNMNASEIEARAAKLNVHKFAHIRQKNHWGQFYGPKKGYWIDNETWPAGFVYFMVLLLLGNAWYTEQIQLARATMTGAICDIVCTFDNHLLSSLLTNVFQM